MAEKPLTACGLRRGDDPFWIIGFTYAPEGVCRRCQRARVKTAGIYIRPKGKLHILRA